MNTDWIIGWAFGLVIGAQVLGDAAWWHIVLVGLAGVAAFIPTQRALNRAKTARRDARIR